MSSASFSQSSNPTSSSSICCQYSTNKFNLLCEIKAVLYCTYYMMEQLSPIKNTLNPSTKKELIDLSLHQQKEFNEDDLVWAKIVGYPWWPAVISTKISPESKVEEDCNDLMGKSATYRVDFFGQPSHAFVDESKIAHYLPNRQFFIDLAQRQHKRYNIQLFKTSINIADYMANHPYEPQPQPHSPPLKKTPIEEQQTATKKQKQQPYQKYDNDKDLNLISLAGDESKLSKFLLRLFLQKNEQKYSLQLIKLVIMKSIRRYKCVKKIENQKIKQLSKWIKLLQTMHIDEIIKKYYPQYINSKTKTYPKSYIFVDQLGIQSKLSEPLKRCDFYIAL